jgi:polysaccharide deacetylase family protein (PEP-CTERM system associated)
MSVDVEDYFHVTAFEKVIPRDSWSRLESRVCGSTELVLELFRRSNVRGTFFVLGWVADQYPHLVRRIASEGHELACHGYAHRLVYEMTPPEFREDLRRAKAAIEMAGGLPVLGHRAPTFSITKQSLWALDVLIEEGFQYDASIFPIHHDRYGIPDAPRHVHRVIRPAGEIWEVPGSTLPWGRLNVPVGGGGYFRMMPYAWTRWAIGRVNAVEAQPVVFYFHPWELDPDQPRVAAPALMRWRHYLGLRRSGERLAKLLASTRFAPICEILKVRHTASLGPLSVVPA